MDNQFQHLSAENPDHRMAQVSFEETSDFDAPENEIPIHYRSLLEPVDLVSISKRLAGFAMLALMLLVSTPVSAAGHLGHIVAHVGKGSTKTGVKVPAQHHAKPVNTKTVKTKRISGKPIVTPKNVTHFR